MLMDAGQAAAPAAGNNNGSEVAEETQVQQVIQDSREKGPQGRYIKLEDRLGSGAYKDVWRAYDTNEGHEVAWNVVKLNRIPVNERKRIKTEVKLLRDIDHKNIIKYYSSWVDREKEQIIFITEIMSHGSLKDYLRRNPMIRWNAVKRWCKQILRGLEFLHEKQIIHRDIKCDNIFVNGATGDVRIGDLGLSTRISEERALQNGVVEPTRVITASSMTCLGTPEFMAPELYEELYSEKVDIYAYGMAVVEMVTGCLPYHEFTAAQIYRKVLNGELPPELEMVEKVNPRAADFIRLCLRDKNTRPSATELLGHEFLLRNDAEDFQEVRVNLWQPTKEESDTPIADDDNYNMDDNDSSSPALQEFISDSVSSAADQHTKAEETTATASAKATDAGDYKSDPTSAHAVSHGVGDHPSNSVDDNGNSKADNQHSSSSDKTANANAQANASQLSESANNGFADQPIKKMNSIDGSTTQATQSSKAPSTPSASIGAASSLSPNSKVDGQSKADTSTNSTSSPQPSSGAVACTSGERKRSGSRVRIFASSRMQVSTKAPVSNLTADTVSTQSSQYLNILDFDQQLDSSSHSVPTPRHSDGTAVVHLSPASSVATVIDASGDRTSAAISESPSTNNAATANTMLSVAMTASSADNAVTRAYGGVMVRNNSRDGVAANPGPGSIATSAHTVGNQDDCVVIQSMIDQIPGKDLVFSVTIPAVEDNRSVVAVVDFVFDITEDDVHTVAEEMVDDLGTQGLATSTDALRIFVAVNPVIEAARSLLKEGHSDSGNGRSINYLLQTFGSFANAVITEAFKSEANLRNPSLRQLYLLFVAHSQRQQMLSSTTLLAPVVSVTGATAIPVPIPIPIPVSIPVSSVVPITLDMQPPMGHSSTSSHLPSTATYLASPFQLPGTTFLPPMSTATNNAMVLPHHLPIPPPIAIPPQPVATGSMGISPSHATQPGSTSQTINNINNNGSINSSNNPFNMQRASPYTLQQQQQLQQEQQLQQQHMTLDTMNFFPQGSHHSSFQQGFHMQSASEVGSEDLNLTEEQLIALYKDDEEFIEFVARYHEEQKKLERDYSQKSALIISAQEKSEDQFKKDMEKLVLKKEDLDKQLDIMVEKLRERMSEFTVKKSHVDQEIARRKSMEIGI